MDTIEVKKDEKVETAAEIIAREKAKHKPDTAKKCHIICRRCNVVHYGKITENGLEGIGKAVGVLMTGQKKEYQGSELVEMLCLKCGSPFWIVNPIGKEHKDLKHISVVWD